MNSTAVAMDRCRDPSTPRDVLVRAGSAGLLVTGTVLAHLPSGVGVPCPVLTLTGVPCPFCGMTTGVRNVMGLRLHAALVANPFAVLVCLAAACGLALPRSWWKRIAAAVGTRGCLAVAVVVVAGSWMFELARYHAL